MRPNLCRTILHVSIVALLLLTLNADIKGDPTDATPKNHTNSTTASDSGPNEQPWMYIYSAAGIAAFVTVVIIASVASMQGCTGKSKKAARTRDQRAAIPMAKQPSPHTSLQAPLRSSPPVPTQRSTQGRTSPSKPNGSPLRGDREPQNTAEEENSSVVYAALNHQPRGAAAARSQTPMDESSEYAVICVEGH